MKYVPLSEDELEKRVEEKIDEVITTVEELDLPPEVIERMVDAIHDYDWAEVVNEEHYEGYEAYCEDLADERRMDEY